MRLFWMRLLDVCGVSQLLYCDDCDENVRCLSLDRLPSQVDCIHFIYTSSTLHLDRPLCRYHFRRRQMNTIGPPAPAGYHSVQLPSVASPETDCPSATTRCGMRSVAPRVVLHRRLNGTSAPSQVLVVDRDVAAGDSLWAEPVAVVCSAFDIAARRQAMNVESGSLASSDFPTLLRLCPAVVIESLRSLPRSTAVGGPAGPNGRGASAHPVDLWLEAFDALQRVLTQWSLGMWSSRNNMGGAGCIPLHWVCEALTPLPPQSSAPACRRSSLLESFCYPHCRPFRTDDVAEAAQWRHLGTECIAIATATVRAFNELLRRFHVTPQGHDAFDAASAALFLDHVRHRRVHLCSDSAAIPGLDADAAAWHVGGVLRHLGYAQQVPLLAASNATVRPSLEDGLESRGRDDDAPLRFECVATEPLRRGDVVRVFVPRGGLLSTEPFAAVRDRLLDETKPTKVRALQAAHAATHRGSVS